MSKTLVPKTVEQTPDELIEAQPLIVTESEKHIAAEDIKTAAKALMGDFKEILPNQMSIDKTDGNFNATLAKKFEDGRPGYTVKFGKEKSNEDPSKSGYYAEFSRDGRGDGVTTKPLRFSTVNGVTYGGAKLKDVVDASVKDKLGSFTINDAKNLVDKAKDYPKIAKESIEAVKEKSQALQSVIKSVEAKGNSIGKDSEGLTGPEMQ